MPCDITTWHPVAAAILVGGQSRRMGQPKHTMVWREHRTMGADMVALARQVCDIVIASGPRDALSEVPMIEDAPALAGQGPLAGIAAVLACELAPRWLIMPCDMPALRVDDLQKLIAVHAPLSCCAVDGQVTPFPMCVHTALAPSLMDYLNHGGRRVQEWVRHCQPEVLPLAGSNAVNINRPEDIPASD